MNKRLSVLFILLLIFTIGIMPIAKSLKGQTPAFNPRLEDEEKGPFWFCYYVIAHDYIWVSLNASLYNDCFGNYAITAGSNAWWYGTMANPASFGGWSVLFAGWQYPKNLGDQQMGQIVYDHNIMWGSNGVVSDFLWDSDIQSPEDSLVYYPGTYKGLTSFYGFYMSAINDDLMESYSQSDYMSFIDDSFSKSPLGVSGVHRQLRWNYPNADDVNIHILELTNDSEETLNPFYFGLYMDADVNHTNAAYNVSYYDPSIRTSYVYHPRYEDTFGVVGITIFDTTEVAVCNLQIGYDETANFSDAWVWDIMLSEQIDYSYTKEYDARILFALGPFNLAPGATKEIAWANPMGYDLTKFNTNVNVAIQTYETTQDGDPENDWLIPNPPPESPFLSVEAGSKKVYVKWSRNRNYIPKPLPAGEQGFFTEENDPSPEYSVGSEASRDPSSGERDWDGYRVYRNLTGMGDIELGDYALVAQLDSTYVYNSWGVVPDSELEKATWDSTYFGEYTDNDPSIFNGFTYYYSVCAYDTGSRTAVPPIPPAYSSALANVTPATPKWDIEETLEEYKLKVEVVPNPYIEGQYTTWENTSRRVNFIHLPGSCTIKVYTLSGLLVRTIEHYNSVAEVEWNLNNDKGQFLAPGAYVFRVLPRDGGDEITGKFMIIR